MDIMHILSPHSPQVDDTPHVCAEPHGRSRIGLVLPDEDGVRDWQQAHQSTMLEELQDLRLICQAPGNTASYPSPTKTDPSTSIPIHILVRMFPTRGTSSDAFPPPGTHVEGGVSLLVNADLFHLGDEDLQQSHDGLQRELALPGENLGDRKVTQLVSLGASTAGGQIQTDDVCQDVY